MKRSREECKGPVLDDLHSGGLQGEKDEIKLDLLGCCVPAAFEEMRGQTWGPRGSVFAA